MTPAERFLRRCAHCGRRIVNPWRAAAFVHAWKDEMVRDAVVHQRCAGDYLRHDGAVWLRLYSYLASQPNAQITELP